MRFKRALKNPDELTTVDHIWLKHKQNGLVPGWSVSQFQRLCAMINATPDEVLALVGLSNNAATRYMKQGCFPTHVAINLHNLQQGWIIKERAAGEAKEAA